MVGLIEFKVIRDGQTIALETKNTDGIEKKFSCLRQTIGSGNTPTAQMQQTNDARASTYIASSGLKEGNNAKAHALFDNKKYWLSYDCIIIIIS